MRINFIAAILISFFFYAGAGNTLLASETSQLDSSTEICQLNSTPFPATLIRGGAALNTLQFTPAASFETSSTIVVAQCCRICKKGKACGNSCISRAYTCRKPPGCACDG
jgi:hypothetical protein